MITRKDIIKEIKKVDRKVDSKLFKDIVFEVCSLNGDYIQTVVANNKEEAEELYCTNENIVICSIWENGDLTIEELGETLKEAGISVRDIVKAPQDLLQELLGEDYIIQPIYSNKHHTEFIVSDNCLEFSFMINNNDYNVFSLTTGEGAMFVSDYYVEKWLKFLKLCREIRNIFYDLQ